MLIPWVHRSVAVWKKGTSWTQGVFFDQWGKIRSNFSFWVRGIVLWRRHWDKTKDVPGYD